MVNYVKSSQLPHAASVNTTSGGDRFLTLTNPTGNTAALQTVDMSVVIAGISANFVNTGSPIIANSITVNSTFVANSSGVYSTNSSSNNITVNGHIVVGNSTVNTFIGWNSTDLSIAEFAGNVNNYVEIAVYNSNSGINASGDISIYDNNGPASNNYIDIGINSNTWSNTSWTINGPSDGYVYTGNTNLSIGTATNNFINFFTSGTLTNNERMRITPSGNVGINNTAPIHTLSVNGNTFIGNNLTVNGSLVVTGNVTLSGTTTYVNSTIITTNDLNFILANNAASNTLANGAGIIVGTSANLVYNSTATSWQSNVSFIPSTNNLNLGSATQLWNFYGNNGFYTGTVNSTSHTIGTAFIANSIGVFVGNSTVNTQIGANSSAFASIQVFSSFNSFSQISIQNSNTGASASADHVAYNNDGSFNTFVDTGINSSNWSNTLWTINGANDAYLFSSNSNLSVGTNATSGYLNFFVGGTLATNEGMRLSLIHI